MNKDNYNVQLVIKVLERIGFSRYDATERVVLFNHEELQKEVMIDIDQPTLPSFIIERKVCDACIREEFFDSLYDAEVNSAQNP